VRGPDLCLCAASTAPNPSRRCEHRSTCWRT